MSCALSPMASESGAVVLPDVVAVETARPAAAAFVEARDLRTQQFATAMQVADMPEAFPERARSWAGSCASTAWARALVAACVALCACLVLQPPFVLAFDYDARRPWRATVRVSWLAVIVTAALLAAAAAMLPTLL